MLQWPILSYRPKNPVFPPRRKSKRQEDIPNDAAKGWIHDPAKGHYTVEKEISPGQGSQRPNRTDTVSPGATSAEALISV